MPSWPCRHRPLGHGRAVTRGPEPQQRGGTVQVDEVDRLRTEDVGHLSVEFRGIEVPGSELTEAPFKALVVGAGRSGAVQHHQPQLVQASQAIT